MSKLNIDSHNMVTIDELETLIETNAQTIINNPELAKDIPPILIHSSPGIGKSSIVKEVCQKLGIECRDVRLSEIEAVDIRGLPSVDKDKGMMKWNAPDFWPRDPESKGIIFLDELNAASKDIQVAAYELILDRKIGDFYKVPDGWYIVSAGNLATDRAVAMTMSSALSNRFLHVELKPDAEQWLKWGYMNNLHPSVLGFIEFQPKHLFNMEGENLERGWPSPRSWDKVSQMVKIYDSNTELLRKIVYGLVGPGKGVEFMAFHKLNKKFDNILDMMLGKIEIKIPEKNDEICALCSTLVYHLWKGKDEKDENARLDGFCKILEKLRPEYIMMCIRNAAYSAKDQDTAARKLLNHPTAIKLLAKYKKLTEKSKDLNF